MVHRVQKYWLISRFHQSQDWFEGKSTGTPFISEKKTYMWIKTIQPIDRIILGSHFHFLMEI